MSQTLDYRRRTWGHNVEFMRKLDDGGLRWEVAIFGATPHKDDYLLLSNGSGETRYQIEDEPEWCRDPDDMYFATIRFAPRARLEDNTDD